MPRWKVKATNNPIFLCTKKDKMYLYWIQSHSTEQTSDTARTLQVILSSHGASSLETHCELK